MEKILFLVAHPDDVAFGMGGTALLLKEKFELQVVCATRGEKAWKEHTLEETAGKRKSEEKDACKMLGAELSFLDEIDLELLPSQNVIDKVASILKQIDFRAVFTLWPIDVHPDHSAIYEICRKAIRAAWKKTELYFCEEGFGIQTTAFHPDVYVDISGVINEKIKMLRLHECQNQDDRMVKLILKQNEFRGLEVSCAYAEAFKMPVPITNRTKSVLMEI